MKLKLHKYITEEIELTFDRFMKVPKQMFDFDHCHLCKIEFDEDEFEDDWVIRARSNETDELFTFCGSCFNKERERKLNENHLSTS